MLTIIESVFETGSVFTCVALVRFFKLPQFEIDKC